MIRVALVDDHTLVRQGIRKLVEDAAGIEVVAEAETGAEAQALAQDMGVDVLLLDVSLYDSNGVQLLPQLARHPGLAVVMVSMHDDLPLVERAFANGADGYVLKRAAAKELIESIYAVHAGDRYLCSVLQGKVSLA